MKELQDKLKEVYILLVELRERIPTLCEYDIVMEFMRQSGELTGILEKKIKEDENERKEGTEVHL